MAQAFEQYVQAQLPRLLRLAGVLAGDRGTGEDVVQEVLLRASQRWEAISATGHTEAYVRRMVVNEYLSWRRKWARMIPRPEVTDSKIVADHAERHAERDALAGRLQRLSKPQRTVLVLRYYEGLSDEAIADVLGCRPGTVRSNVSRALTALRIDMNVDQSEIRRGSTPRLGREA